MAQPPLLHRHQLVVLHTPDLVGQGWGCAAARAGASHRPWFPRHPVAQPRAAPRGSCILLWIPYLHLPGSIIHHLLLCSHLGLGMQRGDIKLHLLHLGCEERQRNESYPARHGCPHSPPIPIQGFLWHQKGTLTHFSHGVGLAQPTSLVRDSPFLEELPEDG